MYYGMGGCPGWWMMFGGLGILLFWGVVIGLVVWGIRSFSRPNDSSSENGHPLAIAERRYVRGGITLQELKEIKTGLGLGDPRDTEETLQRASRM